MPDSSACQLYRERSCAVQKKVNASQKQIRKGAKSSYLTKSNRLGDAWRLRGQSGREGTRAKKLNVKGVAPHLDLSHLVSKSGGGEKVSRCGSTNFGRQRPREATGSRGRRVRPARPRESRLLCVCRDPPTQSHCFAVLRDRCPTVLYECTVWSCRAAGARGGILTTAVG